MRSPYTLTLRVQIKSENSNGKFFIYKGATTIIPMAIWKNLHRKGKIWIFHIAKRLTHSSIQYDLYYSLISMLLCNRTLFIRNGAVWKVERKRAHFRTGVWTIFILFSHIINSWATMWTYGHMCMCIISKCCFFCYHIPCTSFVWWLLQTAHNLFSIYF